MITFRCTQKTRSLLGLRDRDLSEDTEGDLYEWFVDVATVDHHRCLLFTHKVTLYSFWVLAVRKAGAAERNRSQRISAGGRRM